MSNLGFRYCAFNAVVAVALIIGCGGSQPFGAPGAMPQTSTSVSMHAQFGAAGSLRNLARRDADGGKYPQAPLIDVGGILYGTTNNGGAFRGRKTCYGGCGTVFSITTSGVVKVLHSFGSAEDGQVSRGGRSGRCRRYALRHDKCGWRLGDGTVFSITTDGVEKVLHSFGGQGDGSDPIGGSLLEVRGTLYGTTWSGGTFGSSKSSRVYPHLGAPAGCGTVFSITTSGTEKVLHSFGNGEDAQHPWAGLVHIGTGTTLYGTTFFGGIHRAQALGTMESVAKWSFAVELERRESVAERSSALRRAAPRKCCTTLGKGTTGSIRRRGFSRCTGRSTARRKRVAPMPVREPSSSSRRTAWRRFFTGLLPKGGSTDAASPPPVSSTSRERFTARPIRRRAVDEGTVYSVTTAGVEKVLHGFCNGINDGSTPWAGLVNVQWPALRHDVAWRRPANTLRSAMVTRRVAEPCTASRPAPS